MNIMELFVSTACLAACLSTEARAVDTSLYAEAAPEDASFVRFVGFDTSETPVFGGKTFGLTEVKPGAYIPVSSGLLKDVAAGSYASVVRTPEGRVEVITETPRSRDGKVSIFLVNASNAPLDLRLADNAAAVIEDVESGASGMRAVNPVSVSLGVFMPGAEAPIETFDVTLQRGQNLTFLATDADVSLIKHSFGPVAK